MVLGSSLANLTCDLRRAIAVPVRVICWTRGTKSIFYCASWIEREQLMHRALLATDFNVHGRRRKANVVSKVAYNCTVISLYIEEPFTLTLSNFELFKGHALCRLITLWLPHVIVLVLVSISSEPALLVVSKASASEATTKCLPRTSLNRLSVGSSHK